MSWRPLPTLDDLMEIVEHLHLGMHVANPQFAWRIAGSPYDPLRENEALRQSLYDLLLYVRTSREHAEGPHGDTIREKTRRLHTNYSVLLRMVAGDNVSLTINPDSLPYAITP